MKNEVFHLSERAKIKSFCVIIIEREKSRLVQLNAVPTDTSTPPSKAVYAKYLC